MDIIMRLKNARANNDNILKNYFQSYGHTQGVSHHSPVSKALHIT